MPEGELLGWTVVYTDKDGVTWVAPHKFGQGNFYGRVFTKSEAEHHAEKCRRHWSDETMRVVAVYAAPHPAEREKPEEPDDDPPHLPAIGAHKRTS